MLTSSPEIFENNENKIYDGERHTYVEDTSRQTLI
jgi:hypothetical protein